MSDGNETRETHAAVIAEMRECEGYRAYYDGGKHHDSYEESVVGVDYLRDFTDRLEAAHKREVAQLREALEDMISERCALCHVRVKPDGFVSGFGPDQGDAPTREQKLRKEHCTRPCPVDRWRKALVATETKGGNR